MDELMLVPISAGYAERIDEYRAEFPSGGPAVTAVPERIPGLDGLEEFGSAAEWIKVRLPGEEGKVLRYLSVRAGDGLAVGAVCLRLRLEYDDDDLDFASHIGYSVRPSQRGRGYAKEQLRLALGEARRNGIKKVRLVCVDTNAASAGVIRANGGVYVDSVTGDVSGLTVNRYDLRL